MYTQEKKSNHKCEMRAIRIVICFSIAKSNCCCLISQIICRFLSLSLSWQHSIYLEWISSIFLPEKHTFFNIPIQNFYLLEKMGLILGWIIDPHIYLHLNLQNLEMLPDMAKGTLGKWLSQGFWNEEITPGGSNVIKTVLIRMM